jgi:hypothetical protein
MQATSSEYGSPIPCLVPLTKEEVEELKSNLNRDLTGYVVAKALAQQRTAEADKKIAEFDRKICENDQKINEADRKINEADRKIDEADGEIAYGQALEAFGKMKIAEGQALQASGREALKQLAVKEKNIDLKLQQLAIEEKNFITRAFYTTFYGKKPVPTEQIDTIFSTYLADGAISIDKAKNSLKVNSMKPFIRYIDEHKENIKLLNFKPYKTEVYDAKTLADYVAQSSCSIRIIGFNHNIPNTTKEALEEAAKARPGLKIQYFDK